MESGGRVVSYANQIGQIIATTKWVGVRSVQVNREQGLTTNNKFTVEQAAIKAVGAVSCLLGPAKTQHLLVVQAVNLYLLRQYRAKTESRQRVVSGGKGGVKIFQR